MLRGSPIVSGLSNAASVAITGGTITGVSGVSYTLTKGGIPLVGPGTFTMNNNGAFVLGVALLVIYPSAYCYFQAGDIDSGVPAAAGWYYCTFSSTTAGIVFNNTYTSGVALIPASPTAFVTTGPGSRPGDTGEEFAQTLAVPALNSSSVIRIEQRFSMPSNADVKTGRVRLSGNGGTIFFSYVLASTPVAGYIGSISNTGATNAQLSACHGFHGGGTVTTDVLGVVDTSSATTLVLSGQRGTATDNLVMYPPIVEVLS